MNRRDFVRTLITPILILPWTRSAGSSQGEGSLHLLSDHPEDYLPMLIAELRRLGIKVKRDPIVRSVGVGEPQPPSFTAAWNGRVIDLRRSGLTALWRRMREDGLSRRLTVVDLGEPNRSGGPAEEAMVKVDGRVVDRLPLKSSACRAYPVRDGHVTVRTGLGFARVTDSSCRQKICASSPPVSRAGERIVCAPGRFILEIPGRGYWDTTTG